MVINLIDILRERACQNQSAPGYTFLVDGETEELRLGYKELDLKARAIGSLLQKVGARGERILLLYPPGLDFIAAFFGCIYAGAIAVPAYPPHPVRVERSLPRLQVIVRDAKPLIALTVSSILTRTEGVFSQFSEFRSIKWLATDNLDEAGLAACWEFPLLKSNDLAFIQYTSGSTSSPRGVLISHANILHNLGLISRCFEHTADSKGVIWLPPYHDMGLIGGILEPLHSGFPVILMAPASFLQRPLRWLEAITRYKATTSGGPNFAYELCLSRITPEQRETLDLASWKIAFNGAEPIKPTTLERFSEAFKVANFKPSTFYPCYGLAEATLIVSGGKPAALPAVRSFVKEALAQGIVLSSAVPTEAAAETEIESVNLVGCGQSLPEEQILIVDPQTSIACSPDRIGEIWVRGPSIARGYWNESEKTTTPFQAFEATTKLGPFLRTGDLGFISEGELFVTGRLKDLIIIRGRNYYPQDIELSVAQSHPLIQSTLGAAFSVELDGVENLVVVQEVARHYRTINLAEVIANIRHSIAQHHQLQVYAVGLVKPGSIPKTSSGKIQRSACRAQFLAGTLNLIESSILDSLDSRPVKVGFDLKLFQVSNPAEQLVLLQTYLREQIVCFLKTPAFSFNLSQSLISLGIDSLTSVQLKNQIESDLGVAISLEKIIEGDSINDLLDHLLISLTSPKIDLIVPISNIQVVSSKGRLSYGQQALWFLHKLSPSNAANNVSLALTLRPDLDVSCLKQAFEILLVRHPILRTVYLEIKGQPFQKTWEHFPLHFEEYIAYNWSQKTLDEFLADKVTLPFDLENGPVFRVYLFARSEREYLMLLVVHHIAIDLWSLVLMMGELRELYALLIKDAGGAKHSGADKNLTLASFTRKSNDHQEQLFLEENKLQYGLLPQPVCNYDHFVAWEANLLESVAGQTFLEYWRKQLEGEILPLNLPTDYLRPAVQTYQGSSLAFKLEPELVRHLKLLAQTESVTLYTVLLTVFNVLLYRYTGQTDLAVGSFMANRTRKEFEDVIGYFVNPVVLRTKINGQLSIRELLRQAQEVVTGALAKQAYPFPLLVERLRPERDASRSPLFQVAFVLEKPHQFPELAQFVLGEEGAKTTFGELEVASYPLVQRVAQFDLMLMMVEKENYVSASLQYNTSLFNSETINQMSQHLQNLFKAVLARPEQPISKLPLLSYDEYHKLTKEWNITEELLWEEACLHQHFERQAAATPDKTALIYEDRRLTYRELNFLANQLAHHLRSLGVGPEALVGVCMERSVELVISLLAILKAGGAYLPLDPTYPPERLRYILEDSAVSILLTQQALVEHLPVTRARLVCVDQLQKQLSQYSQNDPVNLTRPENLAYLIYTSGSTGQPKGAMNSHRAITNRLLWMQQAYSLEAGERVLQKTPYNFDVSVWEFFWPLIVGATLIVARPGGHKDSSYLSSLIARQCITTIHFVPSMLNIFLQEESITGLKSVLKRVICSGEALTPELVERFFSRLDSRTKLYNLYGPTETAVDVTHWECARPPQITEYSSFVPIGRPISNVQIYLLDQQWQPVPRGVVGEVYIGGVAVGRGYWQRPALTAERFTPDPFSGLPGTRLYRTGDLARYRPDGIVEYLGRVDHQVKIRGFRIELGEIETVIARHPSIKQVVAMAQPDTRGDSQLVAYLVTDQPASFNLAELRYWLREQLPEYMVPQVLKVLENIPLNPNGKIDRQALPIPQEDTLIRTTNYVGPRNDLEQLLLTIWQTVLKVERIGIQDNFFDLGGHSLRLLEVHHQLREALQKEDLSLVKLFEYPTISSLAGYLSQSEGDLNPNNLQSGQVRLRVSKQKESLARQRQKALLQKMKVDEQGKHD